MDGTGDDWGEGDSTPPGPPRLVTEPIELRHARLVLTLMERFGYTYTQLMQEDGELLRLLTIVEMATPQG